MNRNEIKYYSLFFLLIIFGVIGIFKITENILLTLAVEFTSFGGAIWIFSKIIMYFPSYQAFVAPILNLLGKMSRERKLQAIAYEIQGNINQYRESINDEVGEIIPEAQVEWVEDISQESFHRNYDGKLIIKMIRNDNKNENLVKATMYQVSKGALSNSRIYVEPKTNKSIDLVLVKKIFEKQKKKRALSLFIETELNRYLADEDILRDFEKMNVIDRQGIFTRIYLSEISFIPDKQGINLTLVSQIRKEIIGLLNFCVTLASRGLGEEIQLEFTGRFLKSSIILVSRADKYQREGPTPYLQSAFIAIRNGANVLYIMAREDKIPYAKVVANILKDRLNAEIISESLKTYNVQIDDETKQSICIICKIDNGRNIDSRLF